MKMQCKNFETLISMNFKFSTTSMTPSTIFKWQTQKNERIRICQFYCLDNLLPRNSWSFHMSVTYSKKYSVLNILIWWHATQHLQSALCILCQRMPKFELLTDLLAIRAIRRIRIRPNTQAFRGAENFINHCLCLPNKLYNKNGLKMFDESK